jgi:nitrite reductase (NADH) small subunit/3-phenylpropionate/trans-cinnamate dioxygenase ferredoxin subunit
MSTFSKACAVSDVAPGTAKLVAVDGKEIALFNVDGTFYALDNECPHRGGPLGEGDLEGCIVTCPWHAWQYDVRSGESITDDLKVARYDVKVEGGDVLVVVG